MEAGVEEFGLDVWLLDLATLRRAEALGERREDAADG